MVDACGVVGVVVGSAAESKDVLAIGVGGVNVGSAAVADMLASWLGFAGFFGGGEAEAESSDAPRREFWLNRDLILKNHRK